MKTKKALARIEFFKLLSHHFPGWTRGDIILCYTHSLFSKLIAWKAKKDSGHCKVTHAERYLGAGLSLSAELYTMVKPVWMLFDGKHNIYVFHYIPYTLSQRNKIVAESLLYYGKFYDYRGILGQAVTLLTGIDWFQIHIQNKDKFFCSELIAKTETTTIATTNPPTPDNIYDFISDDLKWKLVYSYNNG